MTRNEAVKWLERIEERYILCGDEGFDKARKEALHMAIEALEQYENAFEHGYTEAESKYREILERKRGEWLYKDMKGQFCSVCGKQSVWKFDFCPNCGANMRGDEDE